MVNMYSMNSMGSMGNMGMMNNMYNSSGNVHQNFKNKYGVGYEDFNSRPYAQPYPFAVTPQSNVGNCYDCWFKRFIRKIFSS